MMKPGILLLVLLLAVIAQGQAAKTVKPDHYLEPVDLVSLLPQKPLILNVGPRAIYAQAHIPGAVYIGMTSQAEGIAGLRNHVQKVPKDRMVVLYCGCCPWDRCPNIAPAYNELKALGFSKVKVLHIAQNFGADWVNKGFPLEKGDGSSGK